jgi:hypothetical protein
MATRYRSRRPTCESPPVAFGFGIAPAAYPAGLEPTGTTKLQLAAGPTAVPTARITFTRGRQDMITDTFGGKGVVLYSDEPMFAELALQRMCVAAGWQARWCPPTGHRN